MKQEEKINLKYPDDFVNKIICGDCLEVMKFIPDNSVDLVVTDPPFLAIFATDKDGKYDLGNYTIIEGWWEKIMENLKRVMKDRALFYLFCDWRSYPSFWRVIMKLGMIPVNLVVWQHNSARRFGKYRYCHQLIFVFCNGNFKCVVPSGKSDWFDVWDYPNVTTRERIHPTEKPIKIVKKIIQDASKEGDLILDPFLGSGTLSNACVELKRNFIGIEINPEYCKIAEERLKKVPKRLDKFVIK